MNWDSRDEISLGIQILTLVTTIGTLGVTVYFTSQLVKNDNKRQLRVTEEKLMRRFQATLGQVRGNKHASLQTEAGNLAKRFPKNIDLIFEAYGELLLVDKENRESFDEFVKTMASMGYHQSKKG